MTEHGQKRVVRDQEGIGWYPQDPEYVDTDRKDLKFIPLQGDRALGRSMLRTEV
jgi:hypothetical protein